MMKRSCGVVLSLGAFVGLGCNNSPQPTSSPSVAQTPAIPVSVQAGVGHPKFTIAYQPPANKFGNSSVVVAENTSDGDIVKLLWFFRSMIAAHRLQDLGIHPQAKLPSGEETGMIFIFRGKKCATEVNQDLGPDKQPCGFGEHDSGYYVWGIPRQPPHSDEGELVVWDGKDTQDRQEKRVFAFADDNWTINDEVMPLLK